jgi:hypothetical protein
MTNDDLIPTWRTLEDAFWAQGGKPRPPTTFALGHLKWTRNAHRYPSNSGKTAKWSSSFTSEDGHIVEDPNPPLRNRRNDPDRNWGLGRE